MEIFQDMYMDMCIGMCVDMCVDTCIDMRIDMCVDMCHLVHDAAADSTLIFLKKRVIVSITKITTLKAIMTITQP